jgi:hypothetical protein
VWGAQTWPDARRPHNPQQQQQQQQQLALPSQDILARVCHVLSATTAADAL